MTKEEIKELIDLAEYGYKAMVDAGTTHQEFLKDDRELIIKAKDYFLTQPSQSAEDYFKEYSEWQPKDKFEKSEKRYDWWDMLAFASNYAQSKQECSNKLHNWSVEINSVCPHCDKEIKVKQVSDEEIEKASLNRQYMFIDDTKQEVAISLQEAFKVGAKWMRDKLTK